MNVSAKLVIVLSIATLSCSGATSAAAPSADASSDTDAVPNDAGAIDAPPSDADASAVDSDCPTSTHGPTMVKVPASGATGTFCIDSTEVTNSQYADFLASATASNTTQPPVCAWNSDFAPAANCGGQYDPNSRAEYPVSCIDWCDAYAFCAWAGKRLCGQIGGGPVGYKDGLDPQKSQWQDACTSGTGIGFPYGTTAQPFVCVDSQYSGGKGPATVGSAMRCHGGSAPFNTIFDLSGNVSEWEDSCYATTGHQDPCNARGGSFADPAQPCATGTNSMGTTREFVNPSIGFRCCSN